MSNAKSLPSTSRQCQARNSRVDARPRSNTHTCTCTHTYTKCLSYVQLAVPFYFHTRTITTIGAFGSPPFIRTRARRHTHTRKSPAHTHTQRRTQTHFSGGDLPQKLLIGRQTFRIQFSFPSTTSCTQTIPITDIITSHKEDEAKTARDRARCRN